MTREEIERFIDEVDERHEAIIARIREHYEKVGVTADFRKAYNEYMARSAALDELGKLDGELMDKGGK